jgi:hypothetical protein
VTGEPSELHIGELLRVLDLHGVEYVVTGSVAAVAHGVPGSEKPEDLDIVPAVDPANLARLREALDELTAVRGEEHGEWRVDEMGERFWHRDGVLRPTRPLDPSDPSTADGYYRTKAGQLDVVPDVAGEHGALRSRAALMTIDDVTTWVAGPGDLLAAMSRPRRAKDVPRVRGLRTLIAAANRGVGFVGLRTDRFEEMVGLFRDLIGLPVLHEAPDATWFRLGTDAELHVYADTDTDHAFFTTGPVVGLRVADVDEARARMADAGLEMLTDVERTESSAWCHFRAPDGTVLEIIGPGYADR